MCGLSYSEWLENHQKIFGSVGDKAAFGAIVWKAAQNAKERANLHTPNTGSPKLPPSCKACPFNKLCRVLSHGCGSCAEAWRQLRSGA